ncbi:MAG: DUF3047 domain-containing protein [Nitrospirae bacterium]|nr:DUF3047 domain-containing protein [Candidatus Manganitrophaceae bacterium]
MQKIILFILLMLTFPLFPSSVLSEESPASIILEDFSAPDERGLPKGWIAQKETPDPTQVYQIRKEGDHSYLAASGRPNRFFKKMKWNPHQYPLLSWKWRMKTVPVDSQKEKRAAIYVSLDRDFFGIPKITKYLWSSLAPVGEEVSGGFTSASTLVLRSGPAEAGEWVTETINVLDHFKRLHGEPPGEEAYGIGIMTSIEADFADFVAHR